jgi:Sap, sulfolipid-1-addressing protein
VNSAALQVLLYAFIAAASPLALGSTLAVIGRPHHRFGGLAFGVGVVLGQTIACGLAFALGVAAVPDRTDAHETLRAALQLALGIALIGIAARLRFAPRPPPPQPSRTSQRSRAVLARLEQLSVPKLFFAGAALGVGGPKRLGLTVFAAATISATGWSAELKVAAAIFYVLFATVLVWLPVLLALVFGRRTAEWMESIQSWLAAHRQPLTFYPLTVVGILVVVDAVVALL